MERKNMMKVLNREEQKEYLLSKIGNPVKFTYPEGEEPLNGRLLDRYAVFDGEDDSVAYWNVIDLIEFEGEDENWLRITYYRYKKKDNRWVFAGQTSISDPISVFIELFVKVAEEKEWIRPVFKEVCKELSKVDTEEL